jgi:ABC-2 type transport system ATP-binding protein
VIARGAGLPSGRVDEVLRLVELETMGRRRVKAYSFGMKQRLNLAAALLGDPRVLVLDEPANGLDPQGIRWLRDLLRSMAAEGRTILVSSHVLAEVSQTVDEVVVIHRGRLRASSTLAELTRRHEGGAVRVRSPQAGRLAELLGTAGASVERFDQDGMRALGVGPERVGELAAANGITLHELTLDEPDASLEEVFLQLTSDDRADASASDRVEPA